MKVNRPSMQCNIQRTILAADSPLPPPIGPESAAYYGKQLITSQQNHASGLC